MLEGVVVTGDRRGRELGFPTANVEVAATAPLPPDGVYAGWFERSEGQRHVAAVSVGTRPTYYREGGGRLVEAYLLDFDGDLYGEHVRVGISQMVRGQARFSGSEELIAQMHRDVDAVRARWRGPAVADGPSRPTDGPSRPADGPSRPTQGPSRPTQGLSRSARGHSPPSSRRSGSRRSARSCRTRRCGRAGSRPPGRRHRNGSRAGPAACCG